MDTQDFATATVIGTINGDLTVKATRTQQGGIEDIRTVGCGNDDHAGVAFKAIHFGEELVEGLLAFIVATT